jgi:hypothetical protein
MQKVHNFCKKKTSLQNVKGAATAAADFLSHTIFIPKNSLLKVFLIFQQRNNEIYSIQSNKQQRVLHILYYTGWTLVSDGFNIVKGNFHP